jgi:hypothetical protein
VLRSAFSLAAFSALLLFGQSQPPSPTPAKSGEEPQQAEQSKPPEASTDQQPTQPTSATIHKGQTAQSQNVGTNPGEKAARGHTPDWWLVWFTLALVVAAFLQLLAMLIQARYMRKTIDFAKRSMEITERARVALENFQFHDLEEPQHADFSFSYTITNTGKTNANIIGRLGEITCHDLPATPQYDASSEQEMSVTIAATKGFEFHTDPIPKAKIPLEAIMSGTARLYASGYVHYKDVFGEEQWTYWAYQFRKGKAPIVVAQSRYNLST